MHVAGTIWKGRTGRETRSHKNVNFTNSTHFSFSFFGRGTRGPSVVDRGPNHLDTVVRVAVRIRSKAGPLIKVLIYVTMVSISASTTHTMKKKPAAPTGRPGGKKTGKMTRRASVAPALKPATLGSADALTNLTNKSPDDQKKNIVDKLFRQGVLGETSVLNLAAPHRASTTRDRMGAAADVATAAKTLGVSFVLKECQLMEQMQRILFPQGIETLFAERAAAASEEGGGMSTLKPSLSAVSLTSLDVMDDMTSVTTANSKGTDSKRGKTAPPNTREGCLLLLRALCEIVGRQAEPYLVGAFLAAALDECGSSNSSVREAAQDTTVALVQLAHPWAFPTLICPLLLASLHTTEWRVKAAALERLEQCASTAPHQVHRLIPTLIPAVTNQVWDTKAQVSKAARSALLAVCQTNTNKDIRPAIKAVVNAICKPSETTKAVSELMGTTFVVPVDASTLAILCPVLARALKEKLAQHKRAACLVITNMSKLVVSPADVAPFGSLLVPELQKVASNVQFEEIRDEALKALANLTKALGDLYAVEPAAENGGTSAEEMTSEQARVEEEQERIQQERAAAKQREDEMRAREEEEKKKFKDAMDAQRRLDQLAAVEAQKKRAEDEKKREKQKLSTKSEAGKCQSCGLKKCKKSCMFYSSK